MGSFVGGCAGSVSSSMPSSSSSLMIRSSRPSSSSSVSMLMTFPFSSIVSLVRSGFCGDTHMGTISYLSFLGFGVRSDLGIYATILVPSGASPKVRAYVASLTFISVISITSSDVSIVSDKKYITHVLRGPINILHRSNKALLGLHGVYNSSIHK